MYSPLINFSSTIVIAVCSIYIFFDWRKRARIATPFLFMAALYFAIGYRAFVSYAPGIHMFEGAAVLLFGVLILYVVSMLAQKPGLIWGCIIVGFVPIIYVITADMFFTSLVMSTLGYVLSFAAFIVLLVVKERVRGKLAASLGMSYAFLSLIYVVLSVSATPRYLPWFIPNLMLAASFVFMAYSFATLPAKKVDINARIQHAAKRTRRHHPRKAR